MTQHHWTIHSPAAPTRRGTTLIEMVATLTLLLLLAVSGVRVLGDVTAVGKVTVVEKHGRVSIQRLSERIRHDVHGSDSVTAKQWPLKIQHADREIQYRFNSETQQIDRIVMRDQNRLAMDSFDLPPECQPSVGETDEMIQLVLRRRADQTWMVEVAKP